MPVASAGAVALLTSWVAWAEPASVDVSTDVLVAEEASADEPAAPVEGTPAPPASSSYGGDSPPGAAPGSSEPDDERRVVVVKPRRPEPQRDRAASVVSSADLTERLPRSAPDALRGEPGVYIQQTAHGQASPYLRGLTGQQTAMFFDGVRLNNSTFRQGPNQYFFTIDSRTVDHLEIQRGSASTRWGSDAIGGALIASPIEPKLEPGRAVVVHPRVMMRTTTADAEVGGRAQTSLSVRGKLGVIVGAGYRDVGQLRSGGRVIAPQTGQPQTVPPVFGPDDETQLGTGFRELTDDVRLVWQPRRRHRFTLGYYDYRQYDAPRTDKCPPPTAPQDECLTYLEQFRTLAYGAYETKHGPAAAERARATVSYQRQHELREERRGSPSTTRLEGEDDVHTLGTSVVIDTRDFELAPWASLGARYGLDLYYDRLDSAEEIIFTDVDISVERPRGQYLDGAQYMTSGTWAEVHAELLDAIRLRAGGRGALVVAHAEGEPETSSSPVDRQWATAVGNAGIAADAVPWLTFVFNVDQGFRAPNLDDLTSRQQVGPGFQYENASLRPERSLSLEVGALAHHRWFELEAFAFRTTIEDLIQRDTREVDQCPMGDSSCSASRAIFQLVNLEGQAKVLGVEGGLRVYLPWDLGLRTTVSYAWGEGRNPRAGQAMQPERIPLSRIPPLNGLVEAGWRSERWGVHLVGVLRWARPQTRLAPQDRVDARIPLGGTPGYVVADLRAGYRLAPWILAAVVVENLADAPYRHHGSSTNGPGRGLVAELQFGF
ncbi:TonB-dependent receptor plug domain-containing protein [Paraliomyxa miuraensis]|uniref:TonB-dependent receptor plug domain-containing protein n=1 Tax=Paraliomyxa miuraensis TaxID=376150 RepID=UPI00224C9B95|nr:TonB-dependent receptor [Paraliomyxa miuraensis]